MPLIGIEPSAILTFKDEYLRLCDDLETAHKIASATYMIEEFLALEISKGTITSAQFTTKPQKLNFTDTVIKGLVASKVLIRCIKTFQRITRLLFLIRVAVVWLGVLAMRRSIIK